MQSAQLVNVAQGPSSEIARCPTCGVRMSRTGAGCPKHGQAPRAENGSHFATAEHTGELPIFSGYRMVRFLGRGGYGFVVGAERERDGLLVAIKCALPQAPEAIPTLLREFDVLAHIGTPTVPAVFERGVLANGLPYIVMELIQAPTLVQRLAEQAGPIPLEKAMRILRGIVLAIENVHAKGYVHGDLKPENMLLHADDRVTLIDFSLVTPLGAIAEKPGADTQSFPGTPEYMAPEQCDGSRAPDVRSDIYTLGIVFYEILGGRPPFWGSGDLVRQSQVSHRPTRLSSLTPIPPILEDIVHRCLHKRPEERYQTCAELRAALEGAFASDVIRAFLESEIAAPKGVSVFPVHLTPPSAKPDSKGTSAERKRLRAVLVFFESKDDAPSIERLIKSQGGELASISGKRFVALFGHEFEDNPARTALLCVRELLKRNICKKAKVDIASVSTQIRPNGARRFVSPLFSQTSRFPAESDPDGPLLSPAVASLLPGNDLRSIFDDPAVSRGRRRMEQDAATATEVEELDSMVGQDDVLATLMQSALLVARQGVPTAIRVLGSEGLGKTHLANILERRIRRANPLVRVVPMAARSWGRGEGGIAHLLRSVLSLPPAMQAERGKAFVYAALSATAYATAAPAVALALDFLSIDAPELRPLTAAPGALRSAIALGGGALLRHAAQKAPLVILVDDAHLADEAVLSALEFATLAENRAPIWVLALGRPAFAESKPQWGERAGRHLSVELAPLDAPSAAELCRKLLLPATDVPQAAIERIVARAEAVPLMLIELVRGLKQAGIVRPRSEGNSHFLATEEMDRLPDLPIVEWLAERELHALAPNLAAHARLLAVLADDVTLPEVDAILRRLDEMGEADDFPLDAGAAITRLVGSGILVKARGGGYRFRHPLVREAMAHSVSDAMRVMIHRTALSVYQSGHVVLPDEVLLSRIAAHATGAGDRVFAEYAHLALAERAMSRQRYLDAEIHYSRSIELSTAATAKTYQHRGRMRLLLGRYRDAAVDFEEAHRRIKSASDPHTEAEILLDEAEALDWADDYTKAEALVEEAQKLAISNGSPLLSVRLRAGRGRALHRKSLHAEAAHEFELAIAEADRIGDDAYEPIIVPLLLVGFILQGLGQLKRAEVVLERAVGLCEKHGDLLHLGPALSNVALLRALLGDKAGMVKGYRRVAAIARELGQVFLELTTEFNLGEYLHLMNDLEQAEVHVQRAVAIEKRRSGDRTLAAVDLLLARFELYRGNRDIAREIAQRIRARKRAAVEQGEGDSFLSPSDDVLCSMVELATQDASDVAWDELELRSQRFSVGQEQIEVVELRGISALVAGRAKDACLHLERAITLAERIPTCMHERLHARRCEAQAKCS